MKSPMFLLLPFLLLLAVPSQAADKGLCPDPPGNNEIATLIVNSLEMLRPIMINGSASVGIPVLDPFGPLPHLGVDFTSQHLRLDLVLDEIMIRKISSFVVCSLNLTLGLSQKVDIEVHLEELRADGKYDAEGIALGLFPIFGSGGFDLIVDQPAMTVSAKVSYNPFTDHAKMKDLKFNISFQALTLEMECILGCGDMANLVNDVASDIGKAVFDEVWGYIQPLLETNVLDFINEILKNIKISDLIPKGKLARVTRPVHLLEYLGQRPGVQPQRGTRGLGNANDFMDLAFLSISSQISSSGLDPFPLPDQTLQFMENGIAKLYNGALTGLGSIHRSGTATIDKVAGWVFLYTNFDFDDLTARCTAKVEVNNIGPVVEISAGVSRISVYMVARQEIIGGSSVDIDQFIITEFGKIDVKIDGLGLLDYLLEPLSEVVASAFHDLIADLLQTTVAELIKDELQETPWPRLL